MHIKNRSCRRLKDMSWRHIWKTSWWYVFNLIIENLQWKMTFQTTVPKPSFWQVHNKSQTPWFQRRNIDLHDYRCPNYIFPDESMEVWNRKRCNSFFFLRFLFTWANFSFYILIFSNGIKAFETAKSQDFRRTFFIFKYFKLLETQK